MKVLVSDTFATEGLDLFREQESIVLDYQPGIEAEALHAAIADADALVVRGGTRVTAELLAAAQQLRVICRAGIGAANIDMEAANRQGVVVLNTPFGSTTTIAEHTMAMLLALARMIPQADAEVHAGRWEKDRFAGVELAGKIFGLIGAGKVGKTLAERARSLGMRVLINDPYVSEESIRLLGGEAADFTTLLGRADFIVLHVPLTKETSHLLNEETLQLVKPGCRIVNCATGGLIDEAALAAAIRSGLVAGAALDVLEKEPPEAGNPLLGLREVILTPHLRASTRDAQKNVSVQAAWQVIDFLTKGEVRNALNAPSVSAEQLKALRPYLDLAERLGMIGAQLCGSGVQAVWIEYAGTVTNHPTEGVTLALLKGFLHSSLGDMVNFANATYLAGERGVRVVEARSHTPEEGYGNLIRLRVETDEGTLIVSGACFGSRDVRIVEIDGYAVEAEPAGHLLILRNYDRPGVIAFVGGVLAEAGINIAMMNLSRHKIAQTAITVLTVDTPLTPELLERLRSNDAILSARLVSLETMVKARN